MEKMLKVKEEQELGWQRVWALGWLCHAWLGGLGLCHLSAEQIFIERPS